MRRTARLKRCPRDTSSPASAWSAHSTNCSLCPADHALHSATRCARTLLLRRRLQRCVQMRCKLSRQAHLLGQLGESQQASGADRHQECAVR